MNTQSLRTTLVFLFFFSLFTSPARAQDAVAPSLQIGLGGLDLTKGTLDPAIIADIISIKQEEVRVKLLKNMLLDKVNLSSGTFYTYIDNTINIITREKDEAIRTKNLMENTVNLSFVCAYSEYYLRTLSDTEKVHLKNFIEGYLPLKKVEERWLRKWIENEDRADSLEIAEARKTLKQLYEDSKSLADVRGKEDRDESVKEGRTGVFKETEYIREIRGILIDMAFEAVKADENLTQLGLLRTNYQVSSGLLNQYIELQNDTFRAKIAAKVVYDDMVARLGKLTPYLGYINFLNEQAGLSRSGPLKVKGVLNTMTASNTNISAKIDSCRIFLKAAINNSRFTENTLEVKENVALVLAFIQRVQSIDLKKADQLTLSQLLLTLHKEVLPATRTILTKGQEYVDIGENIRIIQDEIVVMLTNTFEDTTFFKNPKADIFLKLLGDVVKFDKAATYADFLDALVQVTSLFPDDRTKNAVNTIVGFVRSYTKINDDPNNPQITVDVESFLIAFKKLPYDRSRPWEFHFTVGMNSAYFDKGITTSEGESITNFSYFGEKIGVKYKLFDYAYTRSFNKGQTFRYRGNYYTRLVPPTEPTVSNIHVLAYGSGILYNLINSGTSKNFDYPLAGIGLGLTFFNSLDANISWGVPILNDQKMDKWSNSSFINLGLDIQFTEYLQELGKRRREKTVIKYEQEAKFKTKG